MPRVMRPGAVARFTRCSRPSTSLKPSLLSRIEPEAGPSTLPTSSTRTEQSTPRLASILLRKSSQSSVSHTGSVLSSTLKPTSLLSSSSLRSPTCLPSISASTAITTQQIRSVTYGSEYQPSQRVRKRRHGFLARRRSKSGRKVLIRRRMKGRRFLSH